MQEGGRRGAVGCGWLGRQDGGGGLQEYMMDSDLPGRQEGRVQWNGSGGGGQDRAGRAEPRGRGRPQGLAWWVARVGSGVVGAVGAGSRVLSARTRNWQNPPCARGQSAPPSLCTQGCCRPAFCRPSRVQPRNNHSQRQGALLQLLCSAPKLQHNPPARPPARYQETRPSRPAALPTTYIQ